jgi:hypothetical protein
VRPTSSRPTGVPSGAPTKYPTTTAPTRPGQTNKPTYRPTSHPTANLGDWARQSAYQSYVATRGSHKNMSQSYSFSNFFYKGQAIDGQCAAWSSLIDNSLALPFSDLYVSQISTDFLVDNYPEKTQSQLTALCREKNVIAKLVSNLRSRNNFQIDCEQRSWRVFTCDSYPVMCVNCKQNCVKTISCPGASSIINPCFSGCTDRIAAGAAVSFQYSLVIKYPQFYNLTVVSRSQTSISVAVNASAAGNVYCAAVVPGTTLTSVLSLRSAGTAVLMRSPATLRSVTIVGLDADTAYDVHCYTEDFANHVMPLSEAVASRVTTSTTCCREVQLLTAYPSVVQYFATTAVADELRFKLGLNARPSGAVQVSLSLVPVSCVNGASPTESGDAVAVPAKMTMFSNATDLTRTFVVRGATAGCYQLRAVAAGLQRYTGFNYTLTVRNSRLGPIPPKATSAVYSSDGSKLLINFDSATDQGAAVLGTSVAFGSFACNRLLSFTGTTSATCKWLSSTALAATGTPAVPLPTVGTTVNILARTVYAKCMAADCSQYSPASASSLIVAAPGDAIAPTVSILAASTVSACDDTLLDPQQSSGHGGRAWSSLLWSVSSDAPAANNTAIAHYLNVLYQTTTGVVTLPNAFLRPGRTYEFTLTATNFLQKAGVGSVTLTVAKQNVVPQLRLIGSTTTSYRWKAISLFASASFPTCAGQGSPQLSYRWQAFIGREHDPTLSSTSLDSRYFKVEPYRLGAGAIYTFLMTVAVKTDAAVGTPVSATASYSIEIGESGVVAAIAGSAEVTTVVTRAVTFDASGSYDIDYPTESSKLTYVWDCTGLSPSYGASCAQYIKSGSTKAKITVPANTLSVGSYNVSVTVSNERGASRRASVALTITSKVIPAVSIDSVAAKYNPQNKVILTGSVVAIGGPVTAQWVSSSVSNLAAVAGTGTMKTIVSGAPVFQLSLPAYSLTAGLSYTFVLQAAYVGSADSTSSSVTAVMNAPPTGGVVSASPSSGTALADLFTITTYLWVDDAADLPLKYVLAYYALSADSLVVVKASDEVSFVKTYLGQGLDSRGNAVSLVAVAADIYGADANTTSTTIVLPVTTTIALTAKTSLALAAAALDGSAATLTQLVGAAVQTINSVDCTVPTSCVVLNRASCKGTARTCGSCLAGYSGVTGDSNLACNPTNTTVGVGGACARDSDCLSVKCTGGVCGDISKTCPNSCSGSGQCVYRSSTGQLTAACSVTNPYCSAQCDCLDGYYGKDCSIAESKLSILMAFRENLCKGLYDSLSLQDVSSDVLNSRAVTVADLVADMTQVNDAAFGYCTAVLVNTVKGNPSLACVGSSAHLISSALSNILARATTTAALSADLMTNVTATISTVAESCVNTLAIGEPPLAIVTDNVRVSAVVSSRETFAGGRAYTVAQSDIESRSKSSSAASVQLNAAELSSDAAVALTLVQYNNNPSGKVTNSTALGVATTVLDSTAQRRNQGGSSRLLAAVDTSAGNGGTYVTLQNRQPLEYLTILPSYMQVKCITPLGDAYTVTATCPSGSVVSVECPAGRKGNYNVTCDSVVTRPVCTSYQDGDYTEDPDCQVVAFTNQSTICFCHNSGTASGLRRRLAAASDHTYATKLSVSRQPLSYHFVPLPPLVDDIAASALSASSGIVAALLVIGLLTLAAWERRAAQAKEPKKSEKDSLEVAVSPIKPRRINDFYRSLVPAAFAAHGLSTPGLVSKYLWETSTWLRVFQHLPQIRPGRAEAMSTFVSLRHWTAAVAKLLTFVFFNSVLAYVVYPYDPECADITSPEVCAAHTSYAGRYANCAWSSRSESCGYQGPEIRIFDVLFFAGLVIATSVIYNRLLDSALELALHTRTFLLLKQVWATCANTLKQLKTSAGTVTPLTFRPEDTTDSAVAIAMPTLQLSGGAVFDEFRSYDTTAGRMLRAARLAMTHKTIHYLDAADEAELLEELYVHGKAGAGAMPDRAAQYLWRFDTPHVPSRYERALTRTTTYEAILPLVQHTRDNAQRLLKLAASCEQDEAKEQLLMVAFLIDTLPSNVQSIAAQEMLSADDRWALTYPFSEAPVWVRDALSVAALAMVAAHFIVLLVLVGVFDASVVATNAPLWGYTLLAVLVQYYLVQEPALILLKDVLIVHTLAGRIITERVELLARRTKVILMRRAGLIRNAHALVQHLNPACRVARCYPFLPVSRLLISLADTDITPLQKERTWSLRTLVDTVAKATLSAFGSGPYIVTALLCDIVVLLLVSILVFGLYFLGSYHPAVGAAVAAALVGMPLLHMTYSVLRKQRMAHKIVAETQQLQEDKFYNLDIAVSLDETKDPQYEDDAVVANTAMKMKPSALDASSLLSGSLVGGDSLLRSPHGSPAKLPKSPGAMPILGPPISGLTQAPAAPLSLLMAAQRAHMQSQRRLPGASTQQGHLSDLLGLSMGHAEHGLAQGSYSSLEDSRASGMGASKQKGRVAQRPKKRTSSAIGQRAGDMYDFGGQAVAPQGIAGKGIATFDFGSQYEPGAMLGSGLEEHSLASLDGTALQDVQLFGEPVRQERSGEWRPSRDNSYVSAPDIAAPMSTASWGEASGDEGSVGSLSSALRKGGAAIIRTLRGAAKVMTGPSKGKRRKKGQKGNQVMPNDVSQLAQASDRSREQPPSRLADLLSASPTVHTVASLAPQRYPQQTTVDRQLRVAQPSPPVRPIRQYYSKRQLRNMQVRRSHVTGPAQDTYLRAGMQQREGPGVSNRSPSPALFFDLSSSLEYGGDGAFAAIRATRSGSVDYTELRLVSAHTQLPAVDILAGVSAVGDLTGGAGRSTHVMQALTRDHPKNSESAQRVLTSPSAAQLQAAGISTPMNASPYAGVSVQQNRLARSQLMRLGGRTPP